VTDEAREEPIITLRPRPPLERLASELRAVRAELVAHSHREIVRHGIQAHLAPDWRALADRYARLLLTAGEMLDVAPPPPPEDYWAMTATERDHPRWRLPVDEWEPFEQRLAIGGLLVTEP
jgi:hypothetical protein